MRHACVIVAAGATLALGACQAERTVVTRRSGPLDPSPYGAPANPQGAAATMEAWRPAWWIEKPVRDAQGSSVAAFGTDKDLLAARKKAVEAAGKQLSELVGATTDAPVSKADTIRLSDGTYRTFVLVSATGSGGT